MKSMMKTAVLTLTAACSGLAWAKSGEVMITQCGGGDLHTVATDSQHTFGSVRALTTVRSNPPGSLFDMMSGQCLVTFSSVKGKPSAWGHCEWTDKDGDKVLFRVSRADDAIAGKADAIHGTGKFSGIKGTRDYRLIPFPTIPGARTVCDEGMLRYTLPD